MTDETGRRCVQESIDIIIMKNKYYHLFIIKIILITYLQINEYPMDWHRLSIGYFNRKHFIQIQFLKIIFQK